MAKKTEYDLRVEILENLAMERERLREQIKMLDLSIVANCLALWACPEMQDEDGR